MMILEFCKWLERTPVSVVIQSVSWIIPTVQTVHILCIAIVVSYSGMLDLRLMGVAGKNRTIAHMVEDFMPWIWTALAILALTGLIMIIGEPARELTNNAFRLKMLLLVAAIAVTLFLQRTVRSNRHYWDSPPATRLSARVIATLSIFLWFSIVTAGRWIAYWQHE